MSVLKKISRALLALGVVASGFAFAAGEPLAAVETQVATQFRAGKSPVDVARALIAAKTDLGLIAAAFVNSGMTPAAAVAAIIDAGGDPAAAVTAVIAAAGVGSAKEVVASASAHAPGQISQITGAAILAGADPTSVLPATAAGPATDGGAPGVNGSQGGGSGPVLSSPSFGGGGGGAASRS